MKIEKDFFARSSDVVARELLGRVIVRKIGKKIYRAKIVETEAYFGEDDPASWARHGKRKDNFYMWSSPGTVLIKNVHKYHMLNFVTRSHGVPGAVLIRALEPLNFEGRCNGPGLLTGCLGITKDFNGLDIGNNRFIWVEFPAIEEKRGFEVIEKFRVGVVKDLDKQLRFYIKDNFHISKK